MQAEGAADAELVILKRFGPLLEAKQKIPLVEPPGGAGLQAGPDLAGLDHIDQREAPGLGGVVLGPAGELARRQDQVEVVGAGDAEGEAEAVGEALTGVGAGGSPFFSWP